MTARNKVELQGAVVVINAGSSSLKFSLFHTDGRAESTLVAHGQVEGIGVRPHFEVKCESGKSNVDRVLTTGEVADHDGAFAIVSAWISEQLAGAPLVAAGHRVVHGGPNFDRPVRIDAQVIVELEQLIPLAPLHQPHNLAAMRAVSARNPALPQVACFDTAFHRGRKELAEIFALPYELSHSGIRRYGFHGLSYEFIARRLPAVAPEIADGRVIVAHLGNGASLCALANRKSVETTMSLTALDGLPMGTRCGSIDPGVVLYLARVRGMTPEAIERMLYNESGLLGISGISSDMRELLASTEPRAKLAIDCFVYHIVREAGALASVLGGLDAFVFTGGIGENAPIIRERVCAGLAWLGIELDRDANRRGESCISRAGSPTAAHVIPTDEERMIAQHTIDTLFVEADVSRQCGS